MTPALAVLCGLVLPVLVHEAAHEITARICRVRLSWRLGLGWLPVGRFLIPIPRGLWSWGDIPPEDPRIRRIKRAGFAAELGAIPLTLLGTLAAGAAPWFAGTYAAAATVHRLIYPRYAGAQSDFS